MKEFFKNLKSIFRKFVQKQENNREFSYVLGGSGAEPPVTILR